MVTGLAETAIGLRAAGSWNLCAVILVSRVDSIALNRGIAEVVGAFELRELNRAAHSSRL